uniref:F-box protein 3 n=1 Tax=Rhipicephalus appendiculatus TaxID=34631 RepID=A0A131YLE5_RHIAP
MEVVGTRRTPNRLSLDDMPCEILINICSYLDYQDLIRCSRLSRRLRDVCAHDPHWRGLCWKYWLETELPEGATWRSHFQELYRDLRRYVHCYAAMKTAWQKIKTFMQKHCPVIAQSIKGNAGTTEEQLDTAERKLGVRFPDDLRCCYRIHNGQRLASPGLMGSMSIPTHYRSESLLDLETAIAGFQSRDGLQGCMPLTFCLHSGLTQFIALHDTDGHAPGCVFYPSQDLTQGVRGHPLDAFITARSFQEWFTGYADMLENEEFVVLDNQPYRFYHVPGCELTTDNITVSVATCFMPELSSVNPPHFFHTYRITMSMSEDASDRESCQLETRHWIITDENGLEERVDGRGVVGEYPVMSPGAYFSWVSCTSLSTTFGNMKGHFVMRNLHTGDMTEVHCPVFNMKCLPYVTSAEREAIKRQRDAVKKAQ